MEYLSCANPLPFSPIITLTRMSPQDVQSLMVVVPWIPLAAIDVEIDIPFVFIPPATLTLLSGIHQI